MTTHNPENERTKRRYFTYLKEAKRYSEASLDLVAKALHRLESYTRFKDFRAFRIEQAIAFKRCLAEQTNARTGERLSRATLHTTLTALKNFHHWLAGQPGYRSRLSYADADYFNLSEKDTRIAKAHREQRVPTIEQIQHVLQMMPVNTEIHLRNRALVAFTLLTGARDSAIASMKLKHVDLADGKVFQDAREVHTKFSKTFTTYFFPVGDDVRAIVANWAEYLRKEKLWSLDDPLFPSTRIVVGTSRQFEVAGLQRKHWTNATPIRRIFAEAFARADLPYFNPHSFRKTLAQLGERVCRTPEEFKAWSQNLGHERVLTTLSSYGQVGPARQAEIIRGLALSKAPSEHVTDLVQQLLRVAQQTDSPSRAAHWAPDMSGRDGCTENPATRRSANLSELLDVTTARKGVQ
jgi:integrase